MKKIDSNKIRGVEIWNNEHYIRISSGLETDNSLVIIKFEAPEDVENLIKKLKRFKKDYNEEEERYYE